MPVFVLLFLAPVYVPLPLLTGWIHDVARLNPATVVLEAGRGLLAGSPVKVGLASFCSPPARRCWPIFARRGPGVGRAGRLAISRTVRRPTR